MAHMNDATASNTPVNTTVPTPAKAPAPKVTPGWHTSEFWMAALGQIGFVLAAASGALPARYAAIAAAASQVAYSVSRGMVKSSAAA